MALKSPTGRDVTKRAIIDLTSIISGRNYDILTSIIAQLLTSQLDRLELKGAHHLNMVCSSTFSVRPSRFHVNIAPVKCPSYDVMF